VRFLIDIEKDSTTPLIESVRTGLTDQRALNTAAANAMLPEVQKTLRNMSESNHNAFGVRDTFWNQMLSATYAGTDGDAGFVSTPRPVALRRFGGTVVPLEHEYMPIAARSEAYGKSPRDFPDLRLAFFGMGPKGPKLGLVQADQQAVNYGRKHRDGTRTVSPGEVKGGMVFFWLVSEATIKPDANVLPTNEVLIGAAQQGVIDYIGLLTRRAA